jgi:TRAP-type C4-dicarboxylate transport system substrate-binding protein
MGGEGINETHLVIQSNTGPKDNSSLNMKAWAEALEEETNGAITFEMNYSGAIASIDEIPNAMRSGIVDVAQPAPEYEPATFPKWNALVGLDNSPGYPRTPVADQLVAAGSNGAFGMDEQLIEELHQSNIHPLLPRYLALPGAHLMCSSKVTSAEDAQGKRVRVSSEELAQQTRALGMTPVNMVFSETYEALQRGTLDCTIMGPNTAAEAGIQDVAKHWTLDPEVTFAGTSAPYVIRWDTWQSLGDEGQQIARRVAADVLLPNELSDRHATTVEGIKTARASGVKFYTWDESASRALEEYGEGAVDRSVAAAEDAGVANPEAWVEEFVAGQERWSQVVEDLGYLEKPGTTWVDVAEGPQIDFDRFIRAYKTQIIEQND